jgi:hypothetical protein
MLAARLLAMCGLAAAEVSLSRTVDSLTLGSATLFIDGPACASSDAYGSNDCTVQWGQTYNAHLNATLDTPVEKGSVIHLDATVDDVVPFKVSCPACGAECTVTVPVIKKTYTYQMPPCPISGTFGQTMSLALPDKSPVPLKTSVKGVATLTDAAGHTVAEVHVSGYAKPGDEELTLRLEPQPAATVEEVAN